MSSSEPATNKRARAWHSARAAQWTGVIGFALPALTLAAYPIWSFPGTQTAGTEVARWATANHDRLMVSVRNLAGLAQRIEAIMTGHASEDACPRF
jgi:hypothetical protein